MKKYLIALGITAVLVASFAIAASAPETPSTDIQNIQAGPSDPISGIGFNDIVTVSLNDNVVSKGNNLLTNGALTFLQNCLGSAACGTPAAFNQIGVGGNTSIMAVSDTVLANQIAANNLTQAAGTYASLGTGVWSIVYTFTATGTQNGINSTGLFNASSGTMFAEYPFTSNVNMISGDTLKVNWTITTSGS